MRDVLDDLVGWWQAGETVGLATVVGTWRSAPRPAGAAMLVGPDGTAVGSVSGGCVEGAVYELAHGGRRHRRAGAAALRRQRRRRVRRRADLRRHHRRVRRAGRRASPSPSWARSRQSVEPDEPVAVVTCRRPGPTTGSAGAWWSGRTARSGTLGIAAPRRRRRRRRPRHARRRAHRDAALRPRRRAARRRPRPCSSTSFAPPPRMLVFGAIDFAAAVARVGCVPRLPRDRVRRPAGVRDAASASPTPTRWSSTGRTGTCRARRTPGGSTSAP